MKKIIAIAILAAVVATGCDNAGGTGTGTTAPQSAAPK